MVSDLSTNPVDLKWTVKVPTDAPAAPDTPVSGSIKSAKSSPVTPSVFAKIQVSQKNIVPSKSWNERAVKYLDDVENKIEAYLPNSIYQTKLDHVGNYIESKFACLDGFNKWLDSNGQGEWYYKLAIFLCKLPMRAVRNIVRTLYSIIKMALYAVVHPIKACTKFAKLLVKLVHALTKPQTWSKVGAGVFGASLGAAAGSGCPLSGIGVGIGFAMMLGGLTVNAVKAALEAKTGTKFDAAKKTLFADVQELPEAAMTGFVTGAILGGIQKAVFNKTVRNWADEFIKENKLPATSRIWFDHKTSEICFGWHKSLVPQILKKMPGWGFWKAPDCMYVKITPTPMGNLTLPAELVGSKAAVNRATVFSAATQV